MKKFSKRLLKFSGATAFSFYSIHFLYTNNYLFSVKYNDIHKDHLNSNPNSNQYLSPYNRNKNNNLNDFNHENKDKTDIFTSPDSHFNSLSYKIERNLILPIVKVTEGTIRFSRAMFYMSKLAQRYMTLQYLYPTKYDINGDEIADPDVDEKWIIAHHKGANDILTLCIKNGGIFIKFGQYISTMHYIIPEIYCETLDVLKDRAPPISIESVSKSIYEELGGGIHDFFKEFDRSPIAAASVAQVHRAVTWDGREVAVKVQYPSVRMNFDVDTFTLDVLVKLTSILFPAWNFTSIAPHVKQDLYGELDFEHERDNARRAALHFSHRKDVHIPIVYDDLTTKRILTTEFIHGFKITDVENLKKQNISINEAVHIMLDSFAEQIFIHGHLHADPHAGNHMIRRNPQKNHVQIVILDHGLYQEITNEFRIEFCKLWKSLIVHDDIYLNQFCSKYNISDPELFSAMMLMRTYDHSIAFSSTLKKKDFEDLKDILKYQMDRMITILTKCPREMLLIFRNLTILRSINIDLGASVNRLRINGEVANRGITTNDTVNFIDKFKLWIDNFLFQYWILRQTFIAYIFEKWIQFGIFIGFIPNVTNLQEEVVLVG